jgi:hypothetical protein
VFAEEMHECILMSLLWKLFLYFYILQRVIQPVLEHVDLLKAYKTLGKPLSLVDHSNYQIFLFFS